MPRPGPQNHIQVQRTIQSDSGRLSQLRGVSVQDVADSLYIHPFMLSRWRKEAREGKIVTKGIEVEKDVAAELKVLRKLKRDYERLKIEHGLLNKAIEFSSKRKATSFVFIKHCEAQYSGELMYSLYEVSSNEFEHVCS